MSSLQLGSSAGACKICERKCALDLGLRERARVLVWVYGCERVLCLVADGPDYRPPERLYPQHCSHPIEHVDLQGPMRKVISLIPRPCRDFLGASATRIYVRVRVLASVSLVAYKSPL